MNFLSHSNLKGQHAFLSASKFHWINYDVDRLITVYNNMLAAERGTELHEFAAKAIELGMKLSHSKKTINRYINDAIGYKMRPEQVLYYSENCFGTADAISFRDDILRIHDLKTGITPTHMEQLEIYAALFCLEYQVDPCRIEIVLRIYQNDDFTEFHPEADDILAIMEKIVTFDDVIERIKGELPQ